MEEEQYKGDEGVRSREIVEKWVRSRREFFAREFYEFVIRELRLSYPRARELLRELVLRGVIKQREKGVYVVRGEEE